MLRCRLPRLVVDGQRIDRRDVATELRLLNPNEIGVLEWYGPHRDGPIEHGGGDCLLLVWTRRYLPH
jgi:hypothetical protein